MRGVATTWARLAGGDHEWTALPRLAAWLCLPAWIGGAAAAVSQIGRSILPTTSPFAETIASSAGAIAVLFGPTV